MGGSSSLMCSEELLAKDLSGKTIIVTGGNSGIGLTTAEQLVKQNATVIVACRRLEAGNEATAPIAKAATERGGAGSVEVMQLDLASLESVRAFAEAFTAKHSSLHTLVNNAGVMNPPLKRTKEGFELQFGTNHLGHFLLTNLLLDTLKSSAPSRIVCLSSCAHFSYTVGMPMGKIDFEDPNYKTRKYDGWQAYAQSKLANLLHAKELAKRLEGTGVSVCSLHPGFVRSNLVNNTIKWAWARSILLPLAGVFTGMIEPWPGAQTSLHCILSDEVEGGCYYAQNGPSGNVGGWPAMPSPNPEAADDAVASRLWELSKRLTSVPDAAAADGGI